MYNLLFILILPLRVNISSVDSSANTLNILTYNVENGLSDSILEQLIKSKADIIALQEATSFYNNGSYIQIKDLAEILNMNYLVPDDGYISKYGLVILSKYNVSNVSVIDYQYQKGTFPRSLLSLQIETPYGKINVMNTHLSFPSYISTTIK